MCHWYFAKKVILIITAIAGTIAINKRPSIPLYFESSYYRPLENTMTKKVQLVLQERFFVFV